MCIEYNGKLCTIVEFQHVKPGKGGAFVRTKLKDIKTGRVVDYTFNSGTKFDTVRLETKKMQYLYNDGADFNFMDNDTFEQLAISAEMVGDAAKWLKENDEATLLYAGEELISIEPQMFVELEVAHTEPGFKGVRRASSCRFPRLSKSATSCRSTRATVASSSACDALSESLRSERRPKGRRSSFGAKVALLKQAGFGVREQGSHHAP